MDSWHYLLAIFGLINSFIHFSIAELILDPEPDVVPRTRIPCPDVEHVCASLMKTNDVTKVDESEYCVCDECKDKKWSESDGRGLTWYHYERSDWLVQYRFCAPIIPKQECREPSEVAAVIQTDSEGWNLRIKKLFCSCPKHRYYLQGWNLATDKKVSTWDYHYICDRPMCDTKKPCSKKYLKDNTTVGYKFPCTCQEGFSCDTSRPASQDIDGNDNAGPYIAGYCEKVNMANRQITITDDDHDEDIHDTE